MIPDDFTEISVKGEAPDSQHLAAEMAASDKAVDLQTI
jgi:hypothetical protein